MYSYFLENTLPLCLLLATALDFILGDPENWPHPVRLYGRAIRWGETRLYPHDRNPRRELLAGLVLTLWLAAGFALLSSAASYAFYRGNIFLNLGLRIWLGYRHLAMKSMRDEIRGIAKALREEGLFAGRKRVARIVGRDTANLTDQEVIRAAIESCAENLTDGVIAPLFFFAIGDLPLLIFFKIVSTMDSMIGYRNARYLHFGRTAARLDDILNYIPARLGAAMICLVALITGEDAAAAFRIWRRDGRKHASPNSAQTEAAMAGALGIQLGGAASYQGVTEAHEKLGDAKRPIEIADLERADRIFTLSSILTAILLTALPFIRLRFFF